MPRAYFIKECQRALRGSRLNWQALTDIKIRWGVSKAAILYRGRQLGVFSEEQYRSGVITLRRHGEALQEHEDREIAHEKPEVILDSMKVLAQQCGMSRKMIADSMFVKLGLIDKLLGAKSAESISNNIVNLQYHRRSN
jgi:Zn-dependent peptidase ImmA (M78 family)